VEVFVGETSHDADIKQDVLVSLLHLLEIFEENLRKCMETRARAPRSHHTAIFSQPRIQYSGFRARPAIDFIDIPPVRMCERTRACPANFIIEYVITGTDTKTR
jgi:hypothetical protein